MACEGLAALNTEWYPLSWWRGGENTPYNIKKGVKVPPWKIANWEPWHSSSHKAQTGMHRRTDTHVCTTQTESLTLTITGCRSTPYMSNHFTLSKYRYSATTGTRPLCRRKTEQMQKSPSFHSFAANYCCFFSVLIPCSPFHFLEMHAYRGTVISLCVYLSVCVSYLLK